MGSTVFSYNHMKFVRVIDADTICFLIDFGFGVFKETSVRIAGIDTPEKRTRDLPQKAAGLACTKFTESMFHIFEAAGASYYMDVIEKPKYAGRCIGDLSIGMLWKDINWGELLLDKKFALPYKGKTKKKFTKKFLQDIALINAMGDAGYLEYIQSFFPTDEVRIDGSGITIYN